MKKLLIIECILLAALVAVGIAFADLSGQEAPAVPVMQTGAQTTQGTTEATTVPETTVPETTAEPTFPALPEPPVEMDWADYSDRELTASSYFVYDVLTGEYLMTSDDPALRVYPASITKLFTAYVAGLYLDAEEYVTVGEELDMVAEDASIAWLAKGEQLTVAQLIQGMLLPSGNDAAHTLAAAAGRVIGNDPEMDPRRAVGVFVDEMNRQTALVGMTDSHFVNPDGMHDAHHYTTMADLAVLGKLSLEDPAIAAGAKTLSVQFTAKWGSEKDWKNTNLILDPESEYYCPYAVGLKTGFTSDAGHCLLSAFSYEGRELIVGVFGCPEMTDRFPDAVKLFNETIFSSWTYCDGVLTREALQQG